MTESVSGSTPDRSTDLPYAHDYAHLARVRTESIMLTTDLAWRLVHDFVDLDELTTSFPAAFQCHIEARHLLERLVRDIALPRYRLPLFRSDYFVAWLQERGYMAEAAMISAVADAQRVVLIIDRAVRNDDG